MSRSDGRAHTQPLQGDGTGHAARNTWPARDIHPTDRVTATVNDGIGAGGGGASAQGSSRCDLLDPGTWPPCFVAAGIDLVTGWVRTIVTTQMFADVWGSTNVLLTVENPVVVRYYTAIRLASDLLLALFAMGVFGEILVCQRAHQTYHHAVEKIWRLVLIAFLSNMSLAVIAQAVDLSNIMTGGVWGVQSSGLDAVMAHTDSGSAIVVASIFELANEVMLLLLFVQMVMRLALLDVLIVLSPLGLLCYGWGPTQEWGQLWRQHFTATLIVQFVQVVALVLGEDLWTYSPLHLRPRRHNHHRRNELVRHAQQHGVGYRPRRLRSRPAHPAAAARAYRCLLVRRGRAGRPAPARKGALAMNAHARSPPLPDPIMMTSPSTRASVD